MRINQRVSAVAIELVKRFEGYRPNAARLPDGRWTVGYAHVRFARQGAHVTPDEAEALLRFDLSTAADQIDRLIQAPLNDNQFSALTAFAFNIGLESFAASRVVQLVNAGEYFLAASAMEMWRRAELDGQRQVIDALVRRRAAEKALYLAPLDNFPVAPSRILRPLCDVMFTTPSNLRDARPAVVSTPLTGEVARFDVVDAATPSTAPVASPFAPAPASAPPVVTPAASSGVVQASSRRKPRAQQPIFSRSLPYYLAAVVGAVLFAGAITMLLRDATWTSLCVGVLGAVMLAPGVGQLIVALGVALGRSRSDSGTGERQAA